MGVRSIVVGLAVLISPASLHAQAWDSPSFFSPRPGEDLGLYVIQPDGGDVGFAGIWRQSGNINLGVRAGLAGSDHFHVGSEFFGTLDMLGPSSPVLLSWVLGLGASFNDVTYLRVPFGISAGVRLGAGGIAVMPYVHPRVALDVVVRDTGDGDETSTDVEFPIDIGADAELGESFVLRVGATIGGGSNNTFGAGIAWRMSRRLIVR